MTEGQILFGKYIIVPANDLVFFDEKNKKQFISSKLIIEGKNNNKSFLFIMLGINMLVIILGKYLSVEKVS